MTPRPACRLVAAAAAAATAAILLSACGSTGIGAGPLQASVSQTFSNLYILQQVELGNPKPSTTSLATTATCTKGAPPSTQSGAGSDWVCDITYLVTGVATSVTAVYNVNVQTDGCYAADADGPASVSTPLGQEEIGVETRMMTGPDHRLLLNPLWLINSCFDVT